MSRCLIALALVTGLLGGCSVFSSGENWTPSQQQQEAQGPKGAGPLPTEGALWWLGLAVTVIGIAGLILKAKMPLLPSGTAVTAIPTGVGTMVMADFLAQHQWLMWLLPIGLLILGAVELIGRKKIKQWLRLGMEKVKELE